MEGIGSLEQLLQIDPEEATFGSRYHAQLNSGSIAGIKECLRREKWTCQTCNVRIPEFMEVDHKIHKPVCEAHELTTICQFCHNLKHPIWASLRGRIRLVWLPKIPQIMVTRMAWSVFFSSYHTHIPNYFQSVERIIERVDRREAILADHLGSSDAEGFFESLHTVRRFMDTQSFWQKIRELDGFVRFWPTAANASSLKMERPSTSLSYWSTGKFVDMSQQSNDYFWGKVGDPEEYLEKVLNSKADIAEKLRAIEA